MRLAWLAVPMLLAAPACSPVRDYQEALRRLQFSLVRVEPRLELAFPLDRSRIDFDLVLRVDNPSDLPFHVLGFEGELRLDSGGKNQKVGQVQVSRALDLPARGQADLTVTLAFGYQELNDCWPALQQAVRQDGPGTWELAGSLRGEVHGLTLKLPVRTPRSFGTAP